MASSDLDGTAAFRNLQTGGEINTSLRLVISDDGARVLVGDGDDADEVEFTQWHTRWCLGQVAQALQRREYQRRPIHPVPKPQSAPCEVCGGKRYYVDAYSGEVYRCPSCG